MLLHQTSDVKRGAWHTIPAMSEERRVVTILFADVTGSTAMGESNDPAMRCDATSPRRSALPIARAKSSRSRFSSWARRSAIAALDAGHLVADAARATALLALRTKDAADRADAERRLTALGDRAYLQRLAEDWAS